jgi:serine protease
VRLDRAVTLSEARVIAARLMRESDIEVAEPDRIMRPMLTPNDPAFTSQQWNLQAPSVAPGSANLQSAWDISTGSPAVTVAVIDTGYYKHSDFGAATILPGYDFIGNVANANDGDGRDADATDPGDWVTAAENTTKGGPFYGCGVVDANGNPVPNQTQKSLWHGTHVAGIIAATVNNGLGIAGIAPNVRILPARVLGKCGGLTSDIIDAMNWAVGIPVDGVPANPNPARILNLSLGSPGNCSPSFQSAVTDVINKGAIIVAAAGNERSSSVDQPANCTGVLAVTANSVNGDNAWYSNVGAAVFISAPGGGCPGTNYTGNCSAANGRGVYSLVNGGTTTPNAVSSYATYSGTSMAVPHVVGVIALMLSLDSSLTPAQIKTFLQNSARAYPANTICTTSAANLCGAGLLDASAALAAEQAAIPTINLTNLPAVVAPGATVPLAGQVTPTQGASIVSYIWTQQSGALPVTINNANASNASFVAPAVGTYTFTLTATDSNGIAVAATTTAMRVNSPPVLNPVANQTGTTDRTLTFTVTATDVDGDIPIFSAIAGLPAGATLSPQGVFSWANPVVGSYTMTYIASDSYADSAQGTVSITVNAAVTPASSGGSSGGGGGGSFDGALLAALALLALALRLKKAQASNNE